MINKRHSFEFEEYIAEYELDKTDLSLLLCAREATKKAYAPYSKFLVGAAALLANNEIVTGSNQENASYPAGICAERALLASSAQLFPQVPVITLAITYNNLLNESDKPITPCGFCRQVIAEQEIRFNQSMRLILCGKKGAVYIFPKASMLLPFGFGIQEF